jgi:hypothetical protein
MLVRPIIRSLQIASRSRRGRLSKSSASAPTEITYYGDIISERLNDHGPVKSAKGLYQRLNDLIELYDSLTSSNFVSPLTAIFGELKATAIDVADIARVEALARALEFWEKEVRNI